MLALDADAVIYAPLMPNVEEVAALLRSGKNVVTPVGWFYPGEKEAGPLEVAARAGNATLHGAGIGPGAATELFPLLLSVMSTGVTFVRAEEFSDLRTYAAPDVLRYVMGFGGTPDSEPCQLPWRRVGAAAAGRGAAVRVGGVGRFRSGYCFWRRQFLSPRFLIGAPLACVKGVQWG